MVAAISTLHLDSKSSSPRETHDNSSISRAPLLPSERDNTGVRNGVNSNNTRRTRTRPVSSRYMSPSTSSSTSTTTTTTSTSTTTTTTSSSSSSIPRRFPSPLISRAKSATNSTPRRSQSADRRRSVTPRPVPVTNATEVSTASKLLVTSTRSLSVSFQGESFSLPISKSKPVNSSAGGRKATPERRRATPLRGKVDGGSGDQPENSKPLDQQRWPATNRQFNMLSRSLDGSNSERQELTGSTVVARALQHSLIDDSRRVSFDGILNFDSVNTDEYSGLRGITDTNSLNESSIPSDFTPSDSESVSSGSTSGAQESNGVAAGRGGPRSFVSSARFWQETNMRLRRLQDSGSLLLTTPVSKTPSPKLTQSRKFSDNPSFSPRTRSSPSRGSIGSASPSKLLTNSVASPLLGISPSRLRNSGGTVNANFYDTPSVLSYVVDVRRGKVGENQIIDAHQLRLLYNRQLQWRLVNARADATLLVQRCGAETNLWNAWITIAGRRESVRHKRAQLQLLKQKLKLTSILKGQMDYLEEWSQLDDEHTSSLQGATEALKASILRLPVVGSAAVDIQRVKEAIGSAVDVMHAMASSTCSLLTQVDDVNISVTELNIMAGKERALLEQCKSILSALAALQVKDCSLRTHVLQLNRLRI